MLLKTGISHSYSDGNGSLRRHAYNSDGDSTFNLTSGKTGGMFVDLA